MFNKNIILIISSIIIIIYVLILQYRYLIYFIPNKIILYTPKDFNMNYEEIYIGKLNGWLIKNQTNVLNNKKSNKLIIFFHGNAGNISNRLHIIQQLLNIFDDSDIFIFDYPHFGLSDGKLHPSYLISCCHKVYDYWSCKYNNICLLGESIGAGIMADTYNLIMKTQINLPKMLIHLNGITSLREIADNIMPSIIKPVILPWIDEYDSKKIYLKHITKLPKIIIIHAINDEIVPIKYVKNMIHDLRICNNIHFFNICGTHNNPIFDEIIIKKLKELYN